MSHTPRRRSVLRLLTDWCIPPALASSADSQTLAVAQVVVFLGLAGPPFLLAFAIRNAVLLGNTAAAIPLGIAALVMACVPVLIKIGVAPAVAGAVLAGTLHLSVGIVSFFRGGYVTQVLLWQLFIPLATALLRQRVLTVIFSGLIVVQLLLLYALMQLGVAGLVPDSREHPLPLLGAVALSLLLAATYVRVRDRIELEKEALARKAALEEERRARDEAISAANEEHARQLEERVRTSEEHFRTLVEFMDDTVFTVDSQQRYTGVFSGSLPTSGESPVGRLPADVFGAAAGPHEAANARALAGERTRYEWTLDGPGGVRHFHTSLSPLRGAMGEVTGIVGVSRELTEHKLLQQQLMVSDRMATVGMLAAGVAHEINNPLAFVMANLDVIVQQLDKHAGTGELVEALRDARDGAERIRQIVRDLRIFSRIEDPDRLGPVDVRKALESSLRMAWNEIRHRARLVKDYAQVPPVQANEARLGQVLLNLILNAAQAIAEGHVEDNEIRVSTRVEASGRVVVEVTDTGCGIPPEIMQRLFTPFLTTKAPGVGTGLGLAICHRLVTDFGGEILVRTRVGTGTTLSVVLPVATQDDAATAAPSPIASGRRGRILTIDDELLITRAVQRCLSSSHDVTVANSAQEALALLAKGERFDAILCDLMMPEMTGMDLHAALQRMAPDQAARMIFCTGGAFTPTARAFLEQTPNPQIEKPFDLTELQALINEHVR